MVLPQVKHRVMCLQLLPYKSEVDPHPLHDDFNVRSNDILPPSKSATTTTMKIFQGKKQKFREYHKTTTIRVSKKRSVSV
jgi:hypothetical protein